MEKDIVTYSIGEVAEKFGLSDATIRKYEKDYSINIPRNELNHRYYTQKEVDVFAQVMKLKEQGANIHLIRKVLGRSVDFQEQQEESLDLITMDKMTGLEVKQLFNAYFTDAIIKRENQLLKEYEEKLDAAKKEIQENLVKTMQEEFIKQQELMKTQNDELTSKLENKGFWGRFKRK